MLVHADGDDLVEGFTLFEIAVVLQPNLEAIRQPRLRDLMASKRVLLMADGDFNARDAVVQRGELEQPTPATSDVEQSLPGLQPELAADVFELLFLSGVDVFSTRSEIGARVDQAA
jgi:hypothetical protein